MIHNIASRLHVSRIPHNKTPPHCSTPQGLIIVYLLTPELQQQILKPLSLKMLAELLNTTSCESGTRTRHQILSNITTNRDNNPSGQDLLQPKQRGSPATKPEHYLRCLDHRRRDPSTHRGYHRHRSHGGWHRRHEVARHPRLLPKALLCSSSCQATNSPFLTRVSSCPTRDSVWPA